MYKKTSNNKIDMEFLNPFGKKKIIISEKNIYQKIFIEDFDLESRSFSLEVFVEGEDSIVEIVGRAKGVGNSQKKWNISLCLLGKNQKGLLDLRGVSDDMSRIEFSGGGIIEKDSSGASIEVLEKIILFSQKSKAKNIPILTVKTEDVLSAHHSASIAPFDSEIFFFLESRGISQKEGKKILKEAFLKKQ